MTSLAGLFSAAFVVAGTFLAIAQPLPQKDIGFITSCLFVLVINDAAGSTNIWHCGSHTGSPKQQNFFTWN